MNIVSPIQPAVKDRVVIFDTTLRDGDQSPGFAMTVDEKIRMAHALAEMGVDVIEAGFPVSSDLDFHSVQRIAREVKGPVIAALARASKKDIERAFEAVKGCDHPRIHTFIATSEDHMRFKLQMSPEQVLEKIHTSVSLARSYVADVEWSAEDASRSSIDFLSQAVRVAIDAGATTINLPDTVGYAMPWEYGDMFRQVIANVKPASNIIFSAHTHNDLGVAVANSIEALRGGARQVECTVRGIGERAGNAALEPIVAILDVRGDQNPFTCGIAKEHTKPIADMHQQIIGTAPSYLPIVGDNAFAHGSGIHQDGMAKNKGYEIMDPRKWGHKGALFPLTRHSGATGIKDVVAAMGIDIPGDQINDFTAVFKREASSMLENDKIRIVPPHRVEQIARRFMQQRLEVA
jgi:2-isopropylmalate synthase